MALKKTIENNNDEIIFEEEKKEAVAEKKEEKAEIKETKISIDQLSKKEKEQLIKDLKSQILEEIKKEGVLSETETDHDKEIIDDYLDVPVVFFSFSHEYSIFGDKRKGKEVLPPNGDPIKFKKLYRYRRPAKTGRGVEIVSVSQAVIRSKKEVEYLRNHSLFGIKFFESIDSVQNVDVTLAEKMTEQSNVVSSMNDMQVIERAKREGINISTSDIGYIRQQLIKSLAEKEIKSMRNKIEIQLTAKRDKNNRVIEERNVDVDIDTKTTDVY